MKVIGKLSEAELAKLHPNVAIEPTKPAEYVTLEMKQLPQQGHGNVFKDNTFVSAPVMGVMVMICVAGGGINYAVDFGVEAEPIAPTVREAQAYRATRHACLEFMRGVRLDGWSIGAVLDEEECERFVHKLHEAHVLTIRVLDVPKEAFA